MITLTEQEATEMIKILGKLPSEVTGGLYIFLLDRLAKSKQATTDESK